MTLLRNLTHCATVLAFAAGWLADPLSAQGYGGKIQRSAYTTAGEHASRMEIVDLRGDTQIDAVALVDGDLVHYRDPIDHEKPTVVRTGVTDFAVVSDPTSATNPEMVLFVDSSGLWRMTDSGSGPVVDSTTISAAWSTVSNLRAAKWGSNVGLTGVTAAGAAIGIEYSVSSWSARTITRPAASTGVLVELQTVYRSASVEYAVLTSNAFEMWTDGVSATVAETGVSYGGDDMLRVVPRAAGDRVIWVLDTGTYHFLAELDSVGAQTVIALGDGDLRDLALHDIDNDGLQDLFVAGPGLGLWFVDNGTTPSGTGNTHYAIDPLGTQNVSFVAGDDLLGPTGFGVTTSRDLDGDGDGDMVLGGGVDVLALPGTDVNEHNPNHWIAIDQPHTQSINAATNVVTVDLDLEMPATPLVASATDVQVTIWVRDDFGSAVTATPIYDGTISIAAGSPDTANLVFSYALTSTATAIVGEQTTFTIKMELLDSSGGAPLTRTPASIYRYGVFAAGVTNFASNPDNLAIHPQGPGTGGSSGYDAADKGDKGGG